MSWLKPMGVVCLLLVVACADGRRIDDPEDVEQRTCDDLSWRAPVEGEVACPGARDCACGGGSVCCVEVTDHGDGSPVDIDRVACSPMDGCRGLAFVCDGPEDCGPDEVCCAVLNMGGGSWCVSPMECFGLDEMAMCHGAGDCDGLDDCIPAESGTFFDGTAAACQ